MLRELGGWLRDKSRLARVRMVLVGRASAGAGLVAPPLAGSSLGADEPTEPVWAAARRLGVAVRVTTGDGGFDAGRRLTDEEADRGTDLILIAGLDAETRVPAAVLVAALTGLEPVAVVGQTLGQIDDARWIATVAAVRDGLRRVRASASGPAELLAAVGRADLALLAGLLEQAARRRTPVVIDGLAAGAAALAAGRLSPDAADWWLAGHDDGAPALHAALSALGLEPALLAVGAPPGMGALLAVPLLQAALDLG